MKARLLAASLIFSICFIVLADLPCRADFDFPDFSSTTGLTLLGTAQQLGSVLQLTPLTTNQIGAAWYDDAQGVSGAFVTEFDVQLANIVNGGADGFTFTIQGEGTAALGQGGGALGYATTLAGCAGAAGGVGITNSVAIEFDNWSNSCFSDGTGPDGPFDQISVHTLGAMPNSADETAASLGSTTLFPSLRDGLPHSIQISYTPGTLDIYVDDFTTPVLTIAVVLTDDVGSSTAWVGFTAATGGVYQDVTLMSWSFTGGAGGATFLRGDVSGDASVNLGDAISLLNALFIPGSPQPTCEDAADVNDDGSLNLSDPISLLNFLFIPGSATPAPPYPDCGVDPTDTDPLDCATPITCP